LTETDFPPYVQIEPTNYCNLSCPRCPTRYMTYPKGIMEGNVFSAIIDECVGHETVVKLYFLGEPLLHPDFDAMLIYAATHKVPVGVVTNGSLLTERQIKIQDFVRTQEFIDAAVRKTPWKRWGEPEEIARVILFLVIDESDYITGQNICVSGGQVMH
jgi:pyruvate-formate lyase-activating enzyme